MINDEKIASFIEYIESNGITLLEYQKIIISRILKGSINEVYDALGVPRPVPICKELTEIMKGEWHD